MMPDPDLRRSTPLGTALVERIRTGGPLAVGCYMDLCLNHPEFGYYRQRMAIGRAGDFVTSPEISQIFGELVGLWSAVVWQSMGAPSAVTLIELGPGRGTLMRDALRASRLVPSFHKALRVTLVESNRTLEGVQRTTLADIDVTAAWSSTIPLHSGPAIVIANEFFDCQPISQAVLTPDGWCRRLVDIDAADRLQFMVGARTEVRVERSAVPDGTVLEQADYTAVARSLARLAPAAMLAIDYGDVPPAGQRFGDTLQALREHVFEHPLASPGEADLTAHVDFGRLIADVTRETGLVADGPVSQATFLGRLGAVERASRLMGANPADAATIEAGVARLLAPAGMGGRFKAVGFRAAGLPPLPGF